MVYQEVSLETRETAWALRPLTVRDSESSRFDELLSRDGPYLLGKDDPRTKRVTRVAARIVQALEGEEDDMVYGAVWPPRDRDFELSRVMAERARGGGKYESSSKVGHGAVVDFRPDDASPLKGLEGGDWNIYVIDLVSRSTDSFLWTRAHNETSTLCCSPRSTRWPCLPKTFSSTLASLTW